MISKSTADGHAVEDHYAVETAHALSAPVLALWRST
jgi:hypothetical protein